jgi:hypothetical protein
MLPRAKRLVYCTTIILVLAALCRGEAALFSQDTAEYEDDLEKVLRQAETAWRQVTDSGEVQKIGIDEAAVATELAGVQHDMIWRPGFLKDAATRYRQQGDREIDAEQARQMAMEEARPKPIPGHENYASREQAEQAAQSLSDDGLQGISVQAARAEGDDSDQQSQPRYAVCQNINTESENIHPKLNYQLNGALTSAYVASTVRFLNDLISAAGSPQTTRLPEDLATVQGERVHEIWMENNRWELIYNVLPHAQALNTRFQEEFGTTDAEQVDVAKIVALVDGLQEADYTHLDEDAATKLLQFRPYDKIGRREQIKDDIMGVQAVLMILNAVLQKE